MYNLKTSKMTDVQRFVSSAYMFTYYISLYAIQHYICSAKFYVYICSYLFSYMSELLCSAYMFYLHIAYKFQSAIWLHRDASVGYIGKIRIMECLCSSTYRCLCSCMNQLCQAILDSGAPVQFYNYLQVAIIQLIIMVFSDIV